MCYDVTQGLVKVSDLFDIFLNTSEKAICAYKYHVQLLRVTAAGELVFALQCLVAERNCKKYSAMI